MNYEIGYRRPPKTKQFKKGESGNPKGRPRGSRNMSTMLDKELAQTIVVTENGRRKKLSRLEAVVKRLVAGALQGELKALLALVEVLRRTGRLEQQEAESLVPDDYQDILNEYVNKRQSTPVK
jgi:hypothetical protein